MSALRFAPARTLLAMLVVAGVATACRSTESGVPAASLVGTSWVAEEIDERGVLERVESTLSFDSAQRITGQAACNRYFGTVELGEGTIRLKPAGMTRMACAPAVMAQESWFLAALGAVSAFRREAGKLTLLDETGRVRVRLAARSPARGATAPASVELSVFPTQLTAHAFDRVNGPGFVMIPVASSTETGETIERLVTSPAGPGSSSPTAWCSSERMALSA